MTHTITEADLEDMTTKANLAKYVERMSERTDDLEDIACNISMTVDVLDLVTEVLNDENFMGKDKLQSSLALVRNTLEALPQKLNRVVVQYLEYSAKGREIDRQKELALYADLKNEERLDVHTSKT